MAKFTLNDLAPRRQSIPALYDPSDRHGLILEVRKDTRTEKGDRLRDALARETEKAKANPERIKRLAAQQAQDFHDLVDDFVVGFKRLTPKVLQEICRGSHRSLTDDDVAAAEAKLAALNETEIAFDREFYLALLEDCDAFRERIETLATDSAALAEAEEAARKNGFASGSSTGQSAAA